MTSHVLNLVDGEWRGSASAATTASPVDARRTVASVPRMTAAEVTAARAAAARSYAGWRRSGVLARAAVLERAAALLRGRAAEIAADIAGEMGKPLRDATVEVAKSADFLQFYASTARFAQGEVFADARDGVTVTSVRQPLGVVVLVTPWNDPLITPCRKLGPALVAGNTVVIKGAPQTSLTTMHVARALHDAGLPAGVLNTVTGDVAVVAAPLLDPHGLAAVSFTGSTPTGRSIQKQLAGTSVRFQAEMGGKNAAVVLADADLGLAVDMITDAAFTQAGQRCTATSRVIVEDAVHDEFLGFLRTKVTGLSLGSPHHEVDLGPVVSTAHRSSVAAHLAHAAEDGATISVCGDLTVEADQHASYLAPRLVTGVTPAMRIWREEVFGPVLAVRRVTNFDEAVAAVNDSDFGLSATVFTNDLDRARQFAETVQAGQIGINVPTSGWDVHHAFGGFKDSGTADKEQAIAGLRFYTEVKTIAVGRGRR